MEKLKDSLKERARLMGMAAIFLLITTLISMILVYIPTLMSKNIYIARSSAGAIFLGSIFGQVTLLFAISLMDWIFKKNPEAFRGNKNLENIKSKN